MQRLLRLAQKTGSPVIVTDPDGSEPSVFMPLEMYEAMIDSLTMDELEEEDDFDAFEEFEPDQTFDVPLQEMDQDLPFPGEEHTLDRGDEVIFEDVPFDPPIPERKQQSQQSSHPREDIGEERFYLEPIE